MNKWLAYLELTAAMTIVGSSVVAGKYLVNSMPVFLAAGLRFAISMAILIPLLMIREKKLPIPGKKDLIVLFLLSFTGVFLFNVLLLYGLTMTGATESGIITSTAPAIIGLLSYLLLRERIGFIKASGIALSVLGVLFMNVFGEMHGDSRGFSSLPGNLLVFGAVLCEALFTVLGKFLSERVTPLAITTYVSLFGFLQFFPFAVYQGIAYPFAALSIQDWLVLLYYAVVVTVIAYILWYRGVSKVTAGTAGIFTGVLPLSAIFFSTYFLNETLTTSHLVGIGFVLTGIFLVSRESYRYSVKDKES